MYLELQLNALRKRYSNVGHSTVKITMPIEQKGGNVVALFTQESLSRTKN